MSLHITHEIPAQYQYIYSKEALAFVESLVEKFSDQRATLLAEREDVQERINKGWRPDFLPETQHIRTGEWKVAQVPAALQDRRVEITGPAEPKMIINALNSGAKVFMADIEDSLSPTWHKVVEAQDALYHAARGALEYTSPEGKHYALNEQTATLIVRPRGWHLPENHITYKGEPISGALLDFGLFFFHNAAYMAAKGTGPFFYLPKLESYKEAQLWADIFAYSEDTLKLKRGTIKATVLIEVITAVFQMHEILHALKDYAAGLNCGRWDYIFSVIKKFHHDPHFVMPERGQVTMGVPFLHAYSQLLIQTCHQRGAHAMGGMAAFIPIKNDEAANTKAIAAVRADKEREAGLGHDGTWVAHPGLIPVAMEVFDRIMPAKNQVSKQLDVTITATDLLAVPQGSITEQGIRNNISVSIQYMQAWMQGNGCVPINNMMEDAATAEISRSQLWQWVHHPANMADGTTITPERMRRMIDEEAAKLPQDKSFAQATALLRDLVLEKHYEEFLTLPAYQRLCS